MVAADKPQHFTNRLNGLGLYNPFTNMVSTYSFSAVGQKQG